MTAAVEIHDAVEAFLSSNDLAAFDVWIDQQRLNPPRKAAIYIAVHELQERAAEAGYGLDAVACWQALALCADLLAVGTGAKAAHVSGKILVDNKRHLAAIRWLKQSIDGFEARGDNRDIEVASLCLLSACEIASSDRRRALATAERAVTIASELVMPGVTARALMQRAKAKQSLNIAPLPDARRSVELRRDATDDPFVESLSSHLWHFGRMARELGAYDEAHEAFAEMEAIAIRAGDRFDAALAMSERGFAHAQVRELRRASEHLRRAARHAPPELGAAARRWSYLAAVYDGSAPVDEIPDAASLPLESSEDAHMLLAQLLALGSERIKQAIPICRRLIDWAREAGAYEVLIAAHNALGVALARSGDLVGAMKELHRGIYQADGRRLLGPGMDLRFNLIQVFTRRGMLAEAFHVYEFALAHLTAVGGRREARNSAPGDPSWTRRCA